MDKSTSGAFLMSLLMTWNIFYDWVKKLKHLYYSVFRKIFSTRLKIWKIPLCLLEKSFKNVTYVTAEVVQM